MLLLAASSLSFDGFENNNFQCVFNDAGRLGYERIEFNCWYAESLTPGRIREMRRRCEGTGLQPVALHVSAFGGSTSEQLSWNTAHKLRAIEAAVELGCRRVVASGMHIEDRDGERTDTNALLDDLLRELYNLAPYAEEADVLLCLENHCSNVLAGQQAYHYLFDRIDSDHVGICLDGGHLEAAGESIGEFIEAFAPRINHLITPGTCPWNFHRRSVRAEILYRLRMRTDESRILCFPGMNLSDRHDRSREDSGEMREKCLRRL